jgi:hypothetical protein
MSNPNPKNEMKYDIKIIFGKNHEMIWSCGDKTKEETQELAQIVKAKYPEAEVTIEEKTNIFA